MPRLPEVSKADAHPFAQTLYQMIFGDRDPVVEPGTASGTPGNWWTVFALVPDAFDHTTAGFQFYRSPEPQARARAARARPDARRLGRRQHVRVQPALQSDARRRLQRRTGRRDPLVVGRRLLDAGRACRACVHRRVERRPRSGPRRALRRAAPAPVERGDPRAHVHHVHLRDARHDEPGAAARIRRRRRPGRRDRRPVGTAWRTRRDGRRRRAPTTGAETARGLQVADDLLALRLELLGRDEALVAEFGELLESFGASTAAGAGGWSGGSALHRVAHVLRRRASSRPPRRLRPGRR